jgi:hypothetical protein
MKTHFTLDEIASHGEAAVTRGDIHVDLYVRHQQPVAVVLWRGNEPQPFMAFKDSDDGRLRHFSVTANDDIPEHDHHTRELNTRIEIFERGDQPVALRVLNGASGQELLNIGGATEPLQLLAFNQRDQGIFADGFRDRSGLPVSDTAGARLRASLYGRSGRDWPVAKTAQLVASYSSKDIASLLAAVAERSRDDAWRVAHQDAGIVANGELARIVRELESPTQAARTAPPPLVRVRSDENTYSFDVTTQAAQKIVSAHQYTDFSESSLRDDFPYGSVTGWNVKVPKSMPSLQAVDMVGRDLLKGWDEMHKEYRGGPATLTPPPYDPLDMDEAVQYSRLITERFSAGQHAQAHALWLLDPNGGAAPSMTRQGIDEFTATMYSRRDVQGTPIFRQPEGYAWDGLTVGGQARLSADYPWAKISHAWRLNGETFATVDFDQVVTLDDGRRVASLMVPAHKIIETRPDPGAPPRDSVEEEVQDPEGLNDEQRRAVNEFRERNGRYWKQALSKSWAAASYPGMPRDDAALLQQVRNTLGPEWLAQVTKKQLEPGLGECVLSVHHEAWGPEGRHDAHPKNTILVVDHYAMKTADLAQFAVGYAIDAVASPAALEAQAASDAYIWFASKFSSKADSQDRERYALHIHTVNGHEPRLDDYLAIAQWIGIQPESHAPQIEP